MSPRIAWFGFLKLVGKLAKLTCVAALIAACFWGVWWGVQRAFYQNPDFRLQVITLNANSAIDELGVAAAANIDLNAPPNLLALDVESIARKLRNLPEIADARVERHLPSTLAVTVTARSPQAWLTDSSPNPAQTRVAGAMLVDHSAIAYPCPAHQLESASSLPLIILPPSNDTPIHTGITMTQPELRHCLLLLDAAQDADPDALQWIESVQQINAWSIQLVTRQGTVATFGLSDQARQMENLRIALGNAGEKSYLIDTINLIPKYNIPITLCKETAPEATPASRNRQNDPTPPKRR